MILVGGPTPKSPFINVLLGLSSVPVKWHLNLLNGLNRLQECDRRQTDRQTTLREMDSYRHNRLH